MEQRNKIQNIVIEIWKKAEANKKTAWLSDKQWNWFKAVLAPNQPENHAIFVACVLNNGEIMLSNASSSIISFDDEIVIAGYLNIQSTKKNHRFISLSTSPRETKELVDHIKAMKLRNQPLIDNAKTYMGEAELIAFTKALQSRPL
jgi:hypothetical protein